MASTYTPIATQTLGSAAASVTFSSIPGTYTDLVLIANFGGSVAAQDFEYSYNGDTSSTASDTHLFGNGTAALSNRNSNQTRIDVDYMGLSTSLVANAIINIMNYSNTTTFKSSLARANDTSRGTNASVGLWRSTAAITSIQLRMTSGDLLSGSTFSLYGIASA